MRQVALSWLISSQETASRVHSGIVALWTLPVFRRKLTKVEEWFAGKPLQYRNRRSDRATRHPKFVLNRRTQLLECFQMRDDRFAGLMPVQPSVDQIQGIGVEDAADPKAVHKGRIWRI